MQTDLLAGVNLREWEGDVPITADKFLTHYLDNAGSAEMNVVGSIGTPVDFTYVADVETYVARNNIYIQDAAPSPTEFGGLPALTNGVLVQVLDDQGAVLQSFNEGNPIKVNSDFIGLAGVDVRYTLGQGVDDLAIRWSLDRHSGGDTLVLREGETFRVRVRDDLTGLDVFHWVLQGRR